MILRTTCRAKTPFCLRSKTKIKTAIDETKFLLISNKKLKNKLKWPQNHVHQNGRSVWSTSIACSVKTNVVQKKYKVFMSIIQKITTF